MSRKYKITGFDWIEKSNLKPHADAQLPMGTDDQASLARSIEDGGLIQPLLVLERPDDLDGAFQVVDGCNRLSAAEDGKLPCVLIQCDNVREVALECLGTGRKRSAGQRIMAYIEMHKVEVLKAVELGDAIAAGGAAPNRLGPSHDGPKNKGNLANFTPDAIAATLSVSNKDVALGIDLIRCIEERKTVPQRIGSLITPARPLNLKDKNDKSLFDVLLHTHANVLAGGTPIRRWKAAAGGKVSTAEGRQEIDYADLFRKGLNHLRTASKKWGDITFAEREEIVKLAASISAVLPADIRQVL